MGLIAPIPLYNNEAPMTPDPPLAQRLQRHATDLAATLRDPRAADPATGVLVRDLREAARLLETRTCLCGAQEDRRAAPVPWQCSRECRVGRFRQREDQD